MNAAELLLTYDRFERREARPVGQRVEAVPPVVRHVGPPGGPRPLTGYAQLKTRRR